jgi:hypothetical protein
MFVGIFGYMMIDEIVEWKKDKKRLIWSRTSGTSGTGTTLTSL